MDMKTELDFCNTLGVGDYEVALWISNSWFDSLTIPGLHYTMHQPTVTTSVCLLWWVLERASMSWTREAAALCTTLLQRILMGSKFCSAFNWYSLKSIKESSVSDDGFLSFVFVRCVEYLLRNDADPAVRDKQGYSAVHYASAYGRTLCLELVSTAAAQSEDMLHVLRRESENPKNHANEIWSLSYAKMFQNCREVTVHKFTCHGITNSLCLCCFQMASETPLDVVRKTFPSSTVTQWAFTQIVCR